MRRGLFLLYRDRIDSSCTSLSEIAVYLLLIFDFENMDDENRVMDREDCPVEKPDAEGIHRVSGMRAPQLFIL